MQQFTVPQFIDVESKVIGPITVKQFIMILAFCVLAAIFYKLFDFALWITTIIPLFFITIFLGFIKINGRPSYYFILNVIQTSRKPSKRAWNHKLKNFESFPESIEDKTFEKSLKFEAKEAPSISKLAELSMIVDTQGAYGGNIDRENIIRS